MHSTAFGIGNTALVLQRFEINPDGPDYISIAARRGGLVAWLMTLLGIDTTTELFVRRDNVEYRAGSLSGVIYSMLPLRAVSVVVGGRTKPFLWLVIGSFLFLSVLFFAFSGGSALMVLILLLLVAGCVAKYYLGKAVSVVLVSHSGFPAGISFKRSLIEGVSVGEEQARQVVELVNRLLIEAGGK